MTRSFSVPILAQTSLISQGLGWTIDQFISQGWWSPNISYTSDVGFANSSVWLQSFNAYMSAKNLSIAADDLTSAAFAAGMVLADAYARAGSILPNAVNAALRATDLDLFYGPITFNSLGQVSLPPICQQYINGSSA